MDKNTVNALPPPPEDDPVLREALKRCSPATYYAACKYRQTGCKDALRTVVIGVVERFVDRDLRSKLLSAPEQLSLTQDLGLDSLTLMEIVMLAEEVFPLDVSNEELSRLRTMADIQGFLEEKMRPRSAPPPTRPLNSSPGCSPMSANLR